MYLQVVYFMVQPVTVHCLMFSPYSCRVLNRAEDGFAQQLCLVVEVGQASCLCCTLNLAKNDSTTVGTSEQALIQDADVLTCIIVAVTTLTSVDVRVKIEGGVHYLLSVPVYVARIHKVARLTPCKDSDMSGSHKLLRLVHVPKDVFERSRVAVVVVTHHPNLVVARIIVNNTIEIDVVRLGVVVEHVPCLAC